MPAWRMSDTLTKTGVDTFLFARLTYATPLNLKGSEFLVLDSWVPAGQRTGAQILAVLHEKNGADYIAATGRALGAAEYLRVYVPLDRFALAGWSKDPNQQLDLDSISEIRIGWGGYLGAEGEKVQFSVALPQLGVVLPNRKGNP